MTIPIVAVHGGASSQTRAQMGDARADAGLVTVRTALSVATEIVGDGGSPFEAVVAAVTVLEDGEELNAGRGSALTEDGGVEMCAAVADGHERRFGAVAAAT